MRWEAIGFILVYWINPIIHQAPGQTATPTSERRTRGAGRRFGFQVPLLWPGFAFMVSNCSFSV